MSWKSVRCITAVSVIGLMWLVLPAVEAQQSGLFSMVDPASARSQAGRGISAAVNSDAPALGFTARKYSLNSVMAIFQIDSRHGDDFSWTIDNPPSRRDRYFGRATVERSEESNSSVLFKVEDLPDKSTYTDRSGSDVEIGAREKSGLLYLFSGSGGIHYVNDFTTQRLELSATDSALKVYREILVEPSERVPDCSDYPEQNLDRYMCLFQGEILPPTPPPSTSEALRNALPSKLVQPKENFELVFAEEFDGATGKRPSSHCQGGLANLDEDKWSFDNDWCDDVDAEDVPCEGMEDGHYYMSRTSVCDPGMETRGKFTYKYGYLETKYTVNLDEAYDQNMAFVIGNHRKSMKTVNQKYGVQVNNYEDFTRFIEMEIDLFEYFPGRQREIAHRFINYHPYVFNAHTEPRLTTKWTRYCDYTPSTTAQLDFLTEEECAQRNELTVTKGLEWTPRGYRMFVKVDGAHDDFIVVRKSSTTVYHRPARTTGGQTTFGNLIQYRGSQKDQFFEFVDDADPDSVLEQVAISHMPLEIWTDAWENFGNTVDADTIETKMKIDYIRVFQPTNRYADMEPVFQ